MKSTPLSTSLLATLLWAAGAALPACGSPEKVVEAPEPAKVVWGESGSEAPGESTSESAEEAAPAKATEPDPAEPSPTEDGAIDLDEMMASKAAAESAEPRARLAAEPEERAATSAPASDPVAAELQKRRDEKARRSAKAKKATPRKRASASSDAEPAAAAYSGSDPCRATSFSVPRVRAACSGAGRSGAKRIMKEAINKATATGQSLKCGDCHSNQRDYALKSNAVRDLTRWLDG